MRDENDYLHDILEAATLAMALVETMTLEEFSGDKRTSSAVLYQLTICGEAAKQLSEHFRTLNPEIPWRFMAASRDVIVHDYAGLDLERIYDTVIADLPPLVEAIRNLLNKLPRD